MEKFLFKVKKFARRLQHSSKFFVLVGFLIEIANITAIVSMFAQYGVGPASIVFTIIMTLITTIAALASFFEAFICEESRN